VDIVCCCKGVLYGVLGPSASKLGAWSKAIDLSFKVRVGLIVNAKGASIRGWQDNVKCIPKQRCCSCCNRVQKNSGVAGWLLHAGVCC
jgi:hypothetical protein